MLAGLRLQTPRHDRSVRARSRRGSSLCTPAPAAQARADQGHINRAPVESQSIMAALETAVSL